MSEDKKRPDAGDTVREGVRSIVGILGALKDAVEQSFEDLRESGERPPESGERKPESGERASKEDPESARSPAQQAKEAVESVRDRFDFVTRKDLEALHEEMAGLKARIRALEGEPGDASAPEDPASPPPEDPASPPPGDEPPEPPPERPFRVHSE